MDLLSFWGPPTSALDCGAFYFFDFVFTGCQSNYDYGRFRSFNGLIKFPLQYAECARSLGQLSHAGKQSDYYITWYYRIHLNLHCLLNLLPLCSSCKIVMNWPESYRMIMCLSFATRVMIWAYHINQGRLPCCLETCVWHWELFWLQKQGRLWKTEVEDPQMMIQKGLVKFSLYFCNILCHAFSIFG